MRTRIASLIALAVVAIAEPALAVPVSVSPRMEFGPVPADTPVVAFSYDVRAVFPPVEARFEAWRPRAPKPPVENPIPLLPKWNDYHLVRAKQLNDFREAFQRAHRGEKELVSYLLPKFDAVYKKYGDTAPFGSSADALATENPRQKWAERVTLELNAIITAYNQHGMKDMAAPDSDYDVVMARWRGQRNEALRIAAARAGAHPTVSFVEGTTSEGGQAVLDLPAGVWYVACQAEGKSWYKPIRIAEQGGHIVLSVREAATSRLDLEAWTGQ